MRFLRLRLLAPLGPLLALPFATPAFADPGGFDPAPVPG